MDFLGVPLYDDDFLKLCVRLLLNCAVVALVVRISCSGPFRSRDYIFTFLMINILVFFICFTLKKFDLGLGMALGLFAIFGILRYRTDTIPIREMTYLFTVIGIGVINALANKKMSYAELALTNGAIVAAAAILEKLAAPSPEKRERVLYEKIELLDPTRREELLMDLEGRTGLKITRIELGQINFLNDTVSIDIYHNPQEQSPTDNGTD